MLSGATKKKHSRIIIMIREGKRVGKNYLKKCYSNKWPMGKLVMK